MDQTFYPISREKSAIGEKKERAEGGERKREREVGKRERQRQRERERERERESRAEGNYKLNENKKDRGESIRRNDRKGE